MLSGSNITRGRFCEPYTVLSPVSSVLQHQNLGPHSRVIPLLLVTSLSKRFVLAMNKISVGATEPCTPKWREHFSSCKVYSGSFVETLRQQSNSNDVSVSNNKWDSKPHPSENSAVTESARCHCPRLHNNNSQNVLYKINYPHNRPWRPIGLWDVKDPTLSRQSSQMSICLSALRTGRALPPRNIFLLLVPISLTGWVNHRG
jgi:hypothetical protein